MNDLTFALLLLAVGILVGVLLGWFVTRLYERTRVAQLEAKHQASLEKIDWIQASQENLRDTFGSLAAESLRDNSDSFAGRIQQQLSSHEHHFGLLKQALVTDIEKLDANVRELETKREGAYQSLAGQVIQLQQQTVSLQAATTHLVSALKSGPVRGRWGEIQLRKIIELAGMTEHVSFNEQVAGSEGGRPDSVVHLPNEGRIAIDSKFPLDAFLEGMDAHVDEIRKARFTEHVKSMKSKIDDLAKRSYWKQFDPSPELTIMFIPIESCLMVAYEYEPGIIEFALEKKVILASPVTLLGFMKSIAYGWQQFTISKNARKILAQGKDLYDRLEVWIDHYRKTGDRISAAAKAYNESVASLQSRFLPSCRRFQELTALADEVGEMEPINLDVNLPGHFFSSSENSSGIESSDDLG